MNDFWRGFFNIAAAVGIIWAISAGYWWVGVVALVLGCLGAWSNIEMRKYG